MEDFCNTKKIFMTAVINCVRVIPQKEHAKNR